MWKIRDITIENQIVAAPLAGISNPVYREVMREYGAGLVVSEMISDKALHYDNAKTKDMCRTTPNEHPVSLQLFGNDPDTMAEATRYLSTHTDCDIIDINMGCPVTKVLKAHAGSYLMAHPEEAVSVVKAVVQNTDRPVTVKMRAGWDSNHINCVELAKMVEDAGVSAIAIHGRTRAQMYTGQSNLAYIKAVKEAVHIPVIGNGDIHSGIDAKRMLDETGCDAVMIGRALIGQPFLIPEIKAYLAGEEYCIPSYNERLRLCLDYCTRLCAYQGEIVGIRQMRGIASWYLTGMPHAAYFKNELSQVNTLAQFTDVMHAYEEKLNTL